MDKFEQQILDTLSRPDYTPIKAHKLATKLNLSKKLIPDHQEALARLIKTGRVREGKKGKLRLMAAGELIAGVIKRTSAGSGYLIPHEPPAELRGKDIFISPSDLRDAQTGDEVLVCLLNRRAAGGKRCGRIEEILERATSSFVGTFSEQDGQSYVQIDGKNFPEPVLVDDPGAKGAQADDKVVIEMLRFPTHYQPGEGVITKVLGPRGEIGIDTLSVIHEYGLPDEFPESVLADARKQAKAFDETDLSAGRRDLTDETIVTIDPADARDFDDAISLSRDKKGHWLLGVHIADVAHFVPPGSPLDVEARDRGTSVYLPRQVIPMLPEVISNALASLQKGKVRFTKSVFIEFTAEGAPVSVEFARTAIKVTRRFAYEEVLPILEEPDKHRKTVSAKVRHLLAQMHELAMILRARRFVSGALELSLAEVDIDFDKQGTVIGAHESVHDESHQIIEEFMLAANIAVATELADRGLPYLRRGHGDPELTKLQRFAKFVDALGYRLKNCQSRPELQALLDRVKGEPPERAVNYALLRSMKQAEYTALDVGHYALAAENYCHFTSPIRRYPDLTVHRLLDKIFDAKGKPKHADEVELMKLGRHCSNTERRAAAAERELTKVKLLTYMSTRVGEELDAVITGVERFGIFCQGIEIPVEGLVHISALDRDDHYYYDETSMSLIGRRTGKEYRLGDPVRVVVALVDVDRRVLDFRIAAKSNRRKPEQKQEKSATRNKRDTQSSSKKKPKRKSSTGRKRPGKKKQTAANAAAPAKPKGRGQGTKKQSARRKKKSGQGKKRRR